jgi:hypothetical protein|tara:strand:+ start:2227 stop:2463 length:237 start_codon:yes stop_codon:yes gene_type:complete
MPQLKKEKLTAEEEKILNNWSKLNQKEKDTLFLNVVQRLIKVEKKIENLTTLRYTPAAKKELREYIAWSVRQREKSRG